MIKKQKPSILEILPIVREIKGTTKNCWSAHYTKQLAIKTINKKIDEDIKLTLDNSNT